jgi:DMSO/TMAO reductase YedYZ heme-binding membrane subunit
VTGPRLVGVVAAAIAIMCAALVIGYGGGPEAARAVVRWTARTSLVAFALAYVARPLVQLAPSPRTKAVLAQRKWIGLSFATSHLAHLIGIVAIAWPDPGAFVRAQDPSIVIALATFVLLFAMAITSHERIKRAMSATAWKRLHRTGMHFAWLAFTGTYVPAVARSPLYALPAIVLLAIAGARTAAWLRGRRRAQARAAREAA